MPASAAITAPTTRPRRSMSSRAAVSSEMTIAKKMTVTAMYQEVAIQFGDIGPVHHRDRADAVAEIEQEQQQQQRHEHQPHPQPRCEEDQRGGKRRQLIGAGLDEDDGAGRADQPHQRALQGKHAGRGRHRWQGAPGCRRIRHYTLTQLNKRNRYRVIACDNAKRLCMRAQRSNPSVPALRDGLLRCARNDGRGPQLSTRSRSWSSAPTAS